MNYSFHIFKKIRTATVRKFTPIQIWEHISQQKFQVLHEYFTVGLNLICVIFKTGHISYVIFLLQTLGKGEELYQFGNLCVKLTDCRFYQRRTPPLLREPFLYKLQHQNYMKHYMYYILCCINLGNQLIIHFWFNCQGLKNIKHEKM
jgi:hypothetical protein